MAATLEQARQLHNEGRIDEAIAIYAQLLERQDDIDTRILYGLALAQRQHFQQAIAILTQLPQQNFNHDILNAIGIAYHQTGQADKAIAWLQKAIVLGPHPVSFNRLARIYIENGQYAEAEKWIHQCLAHFPEFTPAAINLAIIQNKLDQADKALLTLQQAQRKLGRSSIEIEANRANSLRQLGRDREATAILQQLISAGLGKPEILNNLGHCLLKLGEFEPAEKCFKESLRYTPDDATALWNIALLQLGRGDFANAWHGYGFGRNIGVRPEPPCPQKQWKGESPCAHELLVINEQGLGEEIIFSSFYPVVAEACKGLTVSCDKRLLALFAQAYPDIAFIPHEDVNAAISRHAFICHAGDLPLLCGNQSSLKMPQAPLLSLNEITNNTTTANKKRIGISWRGGKNSEEQRYRSIDLNSLLGHINRHHTIVPLQHDLSESERQVLNAATHEVEFVHLDLRNDLYELAAVINSLDRVITVDNSIAHLSAAMQQETWVLLPRSPYWVWGMQETTPWYPSARLFRQQRPYDWDEVFQQIAKQEENS